MDKENRTNCINLLSIILLIIAASGCINTNVAPTLIPSLPPPVEVPPKSTSIPISIEDSRFLALKGDDLNPGTKEAPWRTMEKAMGSLLPGDVLSYGAGNMMEFTPIGVLSFPARKRNRSPSLTIRESR